MKSLCFSLRIRKYRSGFHFVTSWLLVALAMMKSARGVFCIGWRPERPFRGSLRAGSGFFQLEQVSPQRLLSRMTVERSMTKYDLKQRSTEKQHN